MAPYSKHPYTPDPDREFSLRCVAFHRCVVSCRVAMTEPHHVLFCNWRGDRRTEVRALRALTMYTGDGTWYRTVRIKFPVARLFALAENVGLTMSNGGWGLFTVQHPPYTVLYSTVNVFLLFCMMCSTVLYLVYSSTVLYCSVKSVHSKRPVL